MAASDPFCQALAAVLLREADRRRRTLAEGQATGETLKAIARLERLAADAGTLDPGLVQECRRMLAGRAVARRALQRRDHLLAQVGVIVCPANATDLVCWMLRQIVDDDRAAPAVDIPRASDQARAVPGPSSPPSSRPPGRAPTPGLITSVAIDFTAGFGIVAPMLAVWELGVAIEQWRDQAASQAGVAVPASVVSSESVGGDRHTGLSAQVVLGFRSSPGSEVCQVAMRVSAPVEGATTMVVPRSSHCEPPLVVSEIGDPVTTTVLAAALLIGGLVSLRLWSRLSRLAARRIRPTGPAWARLRAAAARH